MKYLRSVFISLFSLLIFTGCATTHSSQITKGEFAGVDYFFRSKTYFMKQPTPEALAATKKPQNKL